jgi:hypothetical protein
MLVPFIVAPFMLVVPVDIEVIDTTAKSAVLAGMLAR